MILLYLFLIVDVRFIISDCLFIFLLFDIWRLIIVLIGDVVFRDEEEIVVLGDFLIMFLFGIFILLWKYIWFLLYGVLNGAYLKLLNFFLIKYLERYESFNLEKMFKKIIFGMLFYKIYMCNEIGMW